MGISLLKRVRDVWQFRLVDADSGIFDDKIIGPVDRLETNRQAAANIVKFDGIRQQVEDDLFDGARICANG